MNGKIVPLRLLKYLMNELFSLFSLNCKQERVRFSIRVTHEKLCVASISAMEGTILVNEVFC